MGSVKASTILVKKFQEGQFEKGVSLIESMVAMLIFMFGVMGWLSLEMATADESLQTQARSQATFIGNSTADLLKQIPYENLLDSAETLNFDQSGRSTPEDSVFSVSWTVTELPAGDPKYKSVSIQVSWSTLKDGVPSVLDINFERAQ